jgi:hypothetical protein
MTESDQTALLAFFKAMANESRLKIVGLLAQRERSVQELAELLALKEPTVSHHLAVLKELGLVSVRPEGVIRWHALEPKVLSKMNRALLDQKRVEALAPKVESWDEKVLSGFIAEDGKLKAIPSSRRKRRVILKWLVEQFDDDRRYPEKKVNELIQRRHWDSATLRRELIGHRMMAREKGIYWRLPESEWQGVVGAEET